MNMKSSQKPRIAYAETNEQRRLNETRKNGVPWKKWGPYLCERQWGTVREDYSHDGNAWDYFSHDRSRSRADISTAMTALAWEPVTRPDGLG
jgi:hypothetical protein